MIREFYKLGVNESKQLLDEYHEETSYMVEHRSKIVNDFKDEFDIQGCELVQESVLNDQPVVIGYTVDTVEESSDWCKVNSFQDGGITKSYVVPVKKHYRGKRFSWYLDKINNVKIVPFSKYVVDKLLLSDKSPTIMNGGRLEIAVAGYHHDHVVLSIPVENSGEVELVDGVIEITGSEFRRLTENGV